jgi:small conductance mechanosensitive channel
MMRRSYGFLAALLLILPSLPAGAAAILTGGGDDAPAETVEPAATGAIEAERDANEDERIAERIRGIFAAIAALSHIEVTVQQGVVTLTGTVASPEQVEQAGAIAGRVAGVVTVDNQIERDVAVSSNVAPAIENIVSQSRGVLRALPLFGVALVVAGLVIAFTRWLARRKSLWARLSPNLFVAELLASAVQFVGVLFGIYLALKILGATALLGALLGIGGVIGIAIGFAVRDTIDNYISSVMLSLRQPFRANDHVVIGDDEGRVVRLTSRATILMTLDGNHLRIPNSTVFKAVILNYTRNPQRRFDFDLGIDADDDPVDAMETGIRALAALDFVLNDPEPTARIMEVGDSNIVIRFLGWLDQEQTDFYKGRSLGIRAGKIALEDAGFALPEPIYRLRMDPRSAPVTTVGPSPQDHAKPAAKEPRQRSISQEDLRPESHIAELVERERAATGGDLLDSGRPIE